MEQKSMKFFQCILLFSLCAISIITSAAGIKNISASDLTKSIAITEPQKNQASVNLNTATSKDLSALPGFNPSKARAVVAWRKKHGPFAQLSDLRQVSGFKRMSEEKFKNILEKLSVS